MHAFQVALFTFLSVLFTSTVLAAPSLPTIASVVPVVNRDVFVPPIFYPNARTVWTAGSKHNVTWDITTAPAHITNTKGMVVLAKGAYMIGIETPLAKGFPILAGRIEITVPNNTVPGDDYSVVVFGDSGNNSERFTIE